MTADTITRLVAYAEAEQRALAGYLFPARQAESEWVAAHLPKSRREFAAVVAAVHAIGWQAPEVMIAGLLLGIFGEARIVAEARSRKWMAAPKVRSARACIVCGRPATLRASQGWTCANHYDARS